MVTYPTSPENENRDGPRLHDIPPDSPLHDTQRPHIGPGWSQYGGKSSLNAQLPPPPLVWCNTPTNSALGAHTCFSPTTASVPPLPKAGHLSEGSQTNGTLSCHPPIYFSSLSRRLFPSFLLISFLILPLGQPSGSSFRPRYLGNPFTEAGSRDLRLSTFGP